MIFIVIFKWVFVLYFFLLFVILGFSLVYVFLLYVNGFRNLLGLDEINFRVLFYFYYLIKDLVGFVLLLVGLVGIIFIFVSLMVDFL